MGRQATVTDVLATEADLVFADGAFGVARTDRAIALCAVARTAFPDWMSGRGPDAASSEDAVRRESLE